MTSISTKSTSHGIRDSKTSESSLRVIPLGGLHEIGKNTCVFEYGDELMLVDAGLAFPSDGMHGVNVVMPDTSYLRENQKRIRGMIVTHGHEDHIGVYCERDSRKNSCLHYATHTMPYPQDG